MVLVVSRSSPLARSQTRYTSYSVDDEHLLGWSDILSISVVPPGNEFYSCCQESSNNMSRNEFVSRILPS